MNARLSTLIVDDEQHARTNLRLMLSALPDWEIAGECASAAEARSLLAAGGVDMLLLDVQMPRESGLELARDLSRMEQPPLIIFVTAHRGHALEAFDVHALDYIVKPVDGQRLQQALERARTLLGQRSAYAQALRRFAEPSAGYWSTLAVRSVGRIDRVELADVLWMDTAGNYVELHLPQRTLLHRSTLTELERYLDPEEFLRVHRRTLVRRGQMLALRQTGEGSHILSLQCGQDVAVSERYAPAVREALRTRSVRSA